MYCTALADWANLSIYLSDRLVFNGILTLEGYLMPVSVCMHIWFISKEFIDNFIFKRVVRVYLFARKFIVFKYFYQTLIILHNINHFLPQKYGLKYYYLILVVLFIKDFYRSTYLDIYIYIYIYIHEVCLKTLYLHNETDGRILWTAKETILKHKSHLITFLPNLIYIYIYETHRTSKTNKTH